LGLWYSGIEAEELDRLWRMHRFHLEHTFLKQTLGWTKPRLRTVFSPDALAADEAGKG
jgi:hypothetical protein